VFLKVAVFAAPVLAGAVTFWVCRDLRRRDLHPIRRPDRGTLVRTAGGGFERTDDGDPGTGGRD
jgi:hypothetical protein